MNAQKTVFVEGDKAIIDFSDYLTAWRAVCEVRRFLEENWDIGDDAFQAEVFKAATDYVCRCFPCDYELLIDSKK